MNLQRTCQFLPDKVHEMVTRVLQDVRQPYLNQKKMDMHFAHLTDLGSGRHENISIPVLKA
jgi:hypothetical protein